MRFSIFGPDRQALAEAQWALVRAVEQAVDNSYGTVGLEPRRLVADLLAALRNRAATPEAWAEALARSLLDAATEILRGRQTLAAQREQLEALQARLDQLQAQVDAHNADLLVVRVQELEADLRDSDAAVLNLLGRVHGLEAALAGQARSYEAEIARLQAEIAGLNRIVGSQQRKLNDLLAPEG